MDTSLNNRTAIITGGSLGLGLAMAKHFYSAGAKVAILARRPEPLEQAARHCATTRQWRSGRLRCDVTDPKAVIATHKAVVERFGAVDILSEQCRAIRCQTLHPISDEEWQADLDLKLMAAVRLTRLVWPAMQAQKWGRVINLLNVYAKTPDANTAPHQYRVPRAWP